MPLCHIIFSQTNVFRKYVVQIELTAQVYAGKICHANKILIYFVFIKPSVPGVSRENGIITPIKRLTIGEKSMLPVCVPHPLLGINNAHLKYYF